MFDSIPISVCKHLKSIAVFGQDRSEVICVIDEKEHVGELIATV